MQFLKIIGILRVLGLYILFSFNKGEINFFSLGLIGIGAY